MQNFHSYLCIFVVIKQVSVDPADLQTTEHSTVTDVGPVDELQTQETGLKEKNEKVLPYWV